MILLLIQWLLSLGIKVPTVFTYSSTRMTLAAITSLIVTILFGKYFIRKLYEWKIGDHVRSEDCPLLGELHRSKNETPTMGGMLILFSLVVSLLLWMDLQSPFTLILLLTTLLMGALGAIDDALKLKRRSPKGLSARTKFACQTLFAIGVAGYLLWPTLNQGLVMGEWFALPVAKSDGQSFVLSQFMRQLYVPFTKVPLILPAGLMALLMVVTITGFSNAVNLTDGLDGLATGTVLLAASSFAMIAFLSNHLDLSRYLHILYIEGSGEIAVYLAAIVGACLGFLWYNGHPAQVFMGDTGSLPLGAVMGVCAVLLRRELLLGIVGGVFVLEAASVMIQVGSYRLREKKRVFLCAPLHHHFEYKGWAEPKVVIRFWIVGLLLAIIGIASLKFQ